MLKAGAGQLRLGLVINPLAGLGGPAGLKGSDHVDTLAIALDRGVVSKVAERVAQVFHALTEYFEGLEVVTASGSMGEDAIRGLDLPGIQLVYSTPSKTGSEDTIKAAKAIEFVGVDLLLFAGGDGTARDMCQAVGERVPVLGIPAGVKMHSGVFAVTPQAAASVIKSLLSARLVSARTGEVRDIDEEAFARGKVSTRYFGEMLVPDDQLLVQKVKCSGIPDDALLLDELAVYVSELVDDDSLWILGSGGTLYAIKAQLGIDEPTLLGVDLWYCGECVLKDAYEAQIYEWIQKYRQVKIVLSVIGGQGVVLGRGNQQISARIIELVGPDKLQFVATQKKLLALEGRPLLVDSGSASLDAQLSGYHKIICGYEDSVLYPLTRAEVQQ